MVPGYQSWSVTAGEQPTTAYWNILGSNDAAFNTALTAGGVTFASLLSTIFSGQVQSAANSGSAGGTMYWINLGGIKLLWIITSNQSTSSSYSITLPASFFTAIQAVTATGINMTNVGQQYISVLGVSSTTLDLSFNVTNGTSGTVGASVFVIGT